MESLSVANTKFTFANPRKQIFSLPPDIIKKFWENPNSANVLNKLYRTCKYFYSKKQILAVGNETKNLQWCTEKLYYKTPKGVTKECEIFDKNIPIWFGTELSMSGRRIFSFSKMDCCQFSLKSLKIMSSALMMKEFEMLISDKIEEFYLFESKIYIPDNPDYIPNIGVEPMGLILHNTRSKEASIVDILEKLPRIKRFWYGRKREMYNTEKFKQLHSLTLQTKFEYFGLWLSQIQGSLDYFTAFMDKFATSKTTFEFLLSGEIDYKTKVANVLKIVFFKRFQYLLEKPILLINYMDH